MPFHDYNLNIPFGPNNPSVDQPNMLINTNSTYNLINEDHYTFKNINGGFHKQVTLIDQLAPGLRGGSGVVYSTTYEGNSWPVWENALGSTFMMTSPTVDLQNGYTSLPGAMLLQWGQSTTLPVITSVLFPTTFRPGNNAFSVVITYENALPILAPVVAPGSVSDVGFSVISNTVGVNFFWIAIGLK